VRSLGCSIQLSGFPTGPATVRAARQRRKMAEIRAKDFILDFSEEVLLKGMFLRGRGLCF